jgi:hypothetical protein
VRGRAGWRIVLRLSQIALRSRSRAPLTRFLVSGGRHDALCVCDAHSRPLLMLARAHRYYEVDEGDA